MDVKDIIDKIIEICKASDVKSLILYGSYAKGLEHKTSDIDIAVKGCENIDLLEDRIAAIETLRRIDILDLDHKESISRALLEDIKKYGKILY